MTYLLTIKLIVSATLSVLNGGGYTQFQRIFSITLKGVKFEPKPVQIVENSNYQQKAFQGVIYKGIV